MEDMVIIESKDYAQVIFDDVENCYLENKSVECTFSMSGELIKPASTDSVGIFKIGFQLYKDHICIQPVDVDAIQDGKGKVTFPADEKLPKDDGEFYQFIYLSQSKQVRGASIPFQFRQTKLSDYVEVEENEAVVLKSKESAINETISEIKKRCEHLTDANEMYEKLIRENEDLISILKDEVSTVKLRCLRLTMENEKVNQTLKTKSDNIKNLSNTINNLTSENQRMQTRYEDLASENKGLVDSLQHRIDQVTELKKDLENAKYEHVTKLQSQVDERAQELTKIKTDLKRNETLVGQQARTIQTFIAERDELTATIKQLTAERSELETSADEANQELVMARDKLGASEQCNEMLRSQLSAATSELNEANVKIDGYLATIKQCAGKERQLEQEKSELMEKMQQMQADFESKLEQANGSYYALKLAHVHLETRVKSSESGRDKNESELAEQRHVIAKLNRENEELRERISVGAMEYSKLFDKYRHVKHRQFSNEMSQLSNLTSEIAQMRLENNNSSSNNSSGANNMQVVHLRQPFRNSHSSTELDQPERDVTDSAYQEKTFSQCARGSSSSTAEIENTLLDVLLNGSSSLYTNKNAGKWSSSNTTADHQTKPPPYSYQQHHNYNQAMPMPCSDEMNKKFAQLASTSTPIQAAPSDDQSNSAVSISTLTPVPIKQQQQQQQQQARIVPKLSSLLPSHTSNDVLYASNDLKAYEEISKRNMNSKVFGSTYSELQLNLNRSFSSLSSSSSASTSPVTQIPVDQSAAANGGKSVESAAKFSDESSQKRPSPTAYSARKVDLNSLESRNCDICGHVFPSDSGLNEIQNHYTIHYGPSCPICFLTFRKGYPQSEYENHVNSHFPN